MGDVINLNRVRKARAKAAAGKEAENNKVQFGTPKSLRKLSKAEREKAEREIAAKQLEAGTDSADGKGDTKND
jgi:hypothetical protein